jgi:hypothetical protein
MNESFESGLECCNSKEFRHVAKNASSLSCGHSICKECLPNNDFVEITCGFCGDCNEVKLDALKKFKESYAFKSLLNSSLHGLFKNLEERLKVTLEQFKEIHSKEFLNSRIEFLRDEIDIHVDSMKVDLDFLREKLFNELDDIKNKIR